jgi:3-deoxy-D-manno-octulosonic-acid transferase
MENFREIASSLVEEGGAWVVSGETLADRMADLLGSPDLGEAMGERAKVCLLRHRGAADCTADLLGSLLGRSPWG